MKKYLITFLLLSLNYVFGQSYTDEIRSQIRKDQKEELKKAGINVDGINPLEFVKNVQKIDLNNKSGLRDATINAIKKSGANIKQTNYDEFVKKVKTIKVGSDTKDDVVRIFGEPKIKQSAGENDSWNYQISTAFETPVFANVTFDATSKISGVTVTKINPPGSGKPFSEVLYKKGDADELPATSKRNKSEVNTMGKPPENPHIGETYLNTTDSHFYGWNGKEWKQLDK